MDVLEMRPCVSSNAVDIYAVKVACPGPRPVTGYLTVPKDVKDGKRYPVTVAFAGAGKAPQRAPVTGSTNMIRFSLNTQGYDLGKDQAYYDNYFANLCPHKTCGYDRCPEQNKSRYTAFVYGLLLRAIRAVDWAGTIQGCNGDVYLHGWSQGAYQASVAAARAKKPPKRLEVGTTWGLDWSGITVGRLASTYRPVAGYEPELDYFDPCLHAKHVRCPVKVMNVGLGDYCSPPSSLTVFYNNLRTPKEIKYTQGSTHGCWPEGMQSVTVKDGNYGIIRML